MSNEALIVTIFFLVPGFVAVQAYRFILTEEYLNTFELITWSLIYSVLGTLLLAPLPWTRNAVSYVYQPSSLDGASLGGVLLQVVASLVLAIGVAHAIKNWFKGRIGANSFFRRSWDYLWARHGDERRYALVELDNDLLYGVLYFADGASNGRDVLLENPYRYEREADDFFSDGAKFMYVPGGEIRTVKVMVAEPPTAADAPLPVEGYLAGHTRSSTIGIEEASEHESERRES